ncbi:MAG: type II secretion system protein [Candidatus Aminicenantes bacterium]|nr:type II secretion system protein [Candidatus Aminicenantes bacterium]
MSTPRARPGPWTGPTTATGDAERARARRRPRSRGFTLIEVIIVFTLIGVLVGMGIPQYKNARRKANEAVLKENLFQIRKIIDQYYQDKGKYPANPQTLVQEQYFRIVPRDPMTGRSDSWRLVREQPAEGEIMPGQEFGVVDIHSSSDEKAIDGTLYSTW